MRTLWLSAVVACFVTMPLASAQDPVKVDPAHHEVILENEQVRVLRITLKPGEKTPSHQHPGGVAVLLSDASMRLSGTNVPADQTPRETGEVVLVDPTTHVVENTGKTPSEVILVELKQEAVGTSGSGAMPPRGKGAVAADPAHYKVIAENERVRVLRVSYAPGEKSVMHQHPSLVAVPLTTTVMRMHLPDGTIEDPNTLKKGEVIFAPPEQHVPENVGKTTAELILVELKTR